jgi:L-fucose mutarotase
MLKNIPETLSPDLLKIMMEMGHLDELVIGDGNFPGASNARRLVRCDGLGIVRILNDILQFFPLDDISENCISLMKVTRAGYENPPIWEEYKTAIQKWDGRTDCIEILPRSEFYERARLAYAVIATSESALFGNIILKKGVVRK